MYDKKYLIFARQNLNNKIKCFTKNLQNCQNVVFFKNYQQIRNENSNKNLSFCDETICLFSQYTIFFVQAQKLLNNEKYKDYFVPGKWLNHKFHPFLFEFLSRETEILIYPKICKSFNRLLLKNNNTITSLKTMTFEDERYLSEINSNVTFCQENNSFLEDCLQMEKKYSFYDHKIILVKCSKTNNQSFKIKKIKG